MWTRWSARATLTPWTAGRLLIRRDNCQSHRVPLIKQTASPSGRKMVGGDLVLWGGGGGGTHFGWKY